MEITNISKQNSISCNCYYVEENGHAFIVDPSTSPTTLTQKQLSNVEFVLITHTHYDHVCCMSEWARLGKKIYVPEKDVIGLMDPTFNVSSLFGKQFTYDGPYEVVKDQMRIPFGQKEIVCRNYPGHTQGSMIYRIENSFFSGDLIFSYGSYGRVDFPGGSMIELQKSISSLVSISKLDSSFIFYVGHGENVSSDEIIKYFAY